MGSTVNQYTKEHNIMAIAPTIFSRVSVGLSDSVNTLPVKDPADTGVTFSVDGTANFDDYQIAGVAVTATAVELNLTDGLLATTAELNRAADVSTRIVTLTGATSITVGTHEGKILLLGEVGGDASLTVTLPAATGSGAVYKFIISVVNTSNYVIQVVGNDTMDGNILTNSTTDTPDLAQFWPTASDSDTITMNATTTGGVSIGDFVELIDMASDQWAVWGITTTSGTEATPFSAAVS